MRLNYENNVTSRRVPDGGSATLLRAGTQSEKAEYGLFSYILMVWNQVQVIGHSANWSDGLEGTQTNIILHGADLAIACVDGY